MLGWNQIEAELQHRGESIALFVPVTDESSIMGIREDAFHRKGSEILSRALSVYPPAENPMEPIRFPQIKAPTPGEAVRVDVKGVPVAVFNVGGQLRAIAARCTHVGGPLEKGPVAGHIVTCPWHGSQFDLDSGKVVRGPATLAEKSFPVRLEGDVLVVDAP